jgi:hypothetical protein
VSLPRQTASNSESVPRSPSGSPPRELQLVLFPSGLASWNPGISHERSGFHTRHFGPIKSCRLLPVAILGAICADSTKLCRQRLAFFGEIRSRGGLIRPDAYVGYTLRSRQT